MTRRVALIALRDAVEAGWPPDIDTPYMRPFNAAFGVNWKAGLANEANRGSLDAAKALHEAVLPGWRWNAGTNLGVGPVAQVWDDGNPFQGSASDPARAWLLAILEALIAQEPQP